MDPEQTPRHTTGSKAKSMNDWSGHPYRRQTKRILLRAFRSFEYFLPSPANSQEPASAFRRDETISSISITTIAWLSAQKSAIPASVHKAQLNFSLREPLSDVSDGFEDPRASTSLFSLPFPRYAGKHPDTVHLAHPADNLPQ